MQPLQPIEECQRFVHIRGHAILDPATRLVKADRPVDAGSGTAAKAGAVIAAALTDQFQIDQPGRIGPADLKPVAELGRHGPDQRFRRRAQPGQNQRIAAGQRPRHP